MGIVSAILGILETIITVLKAIPVIGEFVKWLSPGGEDDSEIEKFNKVIDMKRDMIKHAGKNADCPEEVVEFFIGKKHVAELNGTTVENEWVRKSVWQ